MDDTIRANKLHHDEAFDFNAEVYPVGFIPEWGLIIGLSQRITYSSLSNLPNFEVQPKVQFNALSLGIFFYFHHHLLDSILFPWNSVS